MVILTVRERLAEGFDNYIVTLQHEIEWPPPSPVLTPCDLFLEFHEIFATPPLTITDFFFLIGSHSMQG